MDGKTKLGLALTGSIISLLAAGYGHLEPGYKLQSGRVTHSWSVAKVSGERVIDVSPNLGWLKLMCSAGAIGLALWSLTESYSIEEAESHASKERSAIAAGRLEVLKLSQAAEIEAMKPVVSAAAETKAQDEVVRLGVAGKVAALPVTEMMDGPPIPEKYSNDLPDFIDELAQSPKTIMCVGVPGAGKGMLLANFIRVLKEKHPNIFVVGVDPKADPQEVGYWSQGFDKAVRFNNENLNAENVLDAIERCIERFKAHEGPKLLVLDEMTVICRRCKSSDKKRYQEIVDYLISICSSGDSRQIYFWGMGQSANADDYGFSGGIRSIFKPIAIVSKTDVAASKQLLGTKFVPTDEGAAEILKMMDYSPVGRAIYWYPEGRWYPMPKLHNYSGYNRDNRTIA